ncbi:M15 family metallopeptidase [Corticimicrobacter populi]|uniref:D-alanyl-D-alanine dipeptidase n=1 Tax=Corticimicrobacter populi TaxID=2175229 RepID=A0A2V1K3E2_9BURK|nr:M15 family metallopeptidase [Corticimicrobacter populi]PWF24743.1 D-alanyl-D-alanine dipeptidase [Corticimicrobacter populi]QDQ86752.1 M15 family metallopeptidase [Alcaligenaceae bacterium SJ-26]
MTAADMMHMPIPLLADPDWPQVGAIAIGECGERLVPTSLMPRPVLTFPAYARQGVAGAHQECYVREDVGRRLLQAARSLPDGLHLVVLDGWRPWRVQQQLFDAYQDTLRRRHPDLPAEQLLALTREFVSLPSTHPARPSPHLTGGAVDVTLCSHDGVWLDMGTPFDATVPASHTAYYESTVDSDSQADAAVFRQRRRILYHAMRAAGFTNLPSEWWHFDCGDQLWAWYAGQPQARYGPAPLTGCVPLVPMGIADHA